MRRREFLAALGSAVVWPRIADAQVSPTRPLIAWLAGGSQPGSTVFVDAFLQGMREHSYEEGHNFDIEYRYADGYVERLPALAEELVRLHPSLILAPASGPAVAARKATSTIPIVTPALADAVHLGLIASESRPGGNVTGIAPYVAGLPAKQMELARQVVPGAAKVGVLANLEDAKAPAQWQELKAAGHELGVNVVAAEHAHPTILVLLSNC
jgi:putative tryptophan/tyrosine transport system substrate-binding protein